MNHLEQLLCEWFEYSGYFVRRNVLVGRRAEGGYECELDVVAFHPTHGHLVHVEPSLDTLSWSKRETKYQKKFKAGRKYIPEMFTDVKIPRKIDQIALFVFASNANRKKLAGGRVAIASELYSEIVGEIRGKRVAKEAIPQKFPLLRTIQYCIEYEKDLFGNGASDDSARASETRDRVHSFATRRI